LFLFFKSFIFVVTFRQNVFDKYASQVSDAVRAYVPRVGVEFVRQRLLRRVFYRMSIKQIQTDVEMYLLWCQVVRDVTRTADNEPCELRNARWLPA
jgi:hypothetical protein